MSTGEIVTILVALGALITAFIAWRRAPTEIRKGEAESRKLGEEADKLQVETLMSLIAMLSARATQLQTDLDGVRLRLDVADRRGDQLNQELLTVSTRLGATEICAAQAEGRLVEAERRVNESRSDIIKVGQELDRERKENHARINELALIVGKLLGQLRALGFEPELSLEDVAMLSELMKVR